MAVVLLAGGNLLLFAGRDVWAREFYVAKDGNDTGPGTKDKPFATLEGARDAIRGQRRSGALGNESVVVWLAGGVYRLRTTFELTAEDSGTSGAAVVWRAAAIGPKGDRHIFRPDHASHGAPDRKMSQSPGQVRFLGGTRITGFKPVSDRAVLDRLDPSARGKVLEANLKEAGVGDLGCVATTAQQTSAERSRAELICNRQYMTLARYPNQGKWLRIATVPQQGGKRYEREGIVHYGRFGYQSDRPARWKDTGELWMHGYWVHDWSDEYQPVAKLDLQKREVYPKPPYHHYGYRQGQRFYFLNVLEELDQPGEWYLDRKSQTLYFWPPCDVKQAEVIFPELGQPMWLLKDVHNLRIEGLTFEATRGEAVVVRGGANVEIAGCTVRNTGQIGIAIEGGRAHRVRSCDIYEVAESGVGLAGGDRNTLARGDHVVENCHIHHFARIQRTHQRAVNLSGVGNRVSHCLIHDAPHEGINYSGNDHLIEYCEFYRIAQETGDVGVIYTCADWTFSGHEFRYNYFHDIHGPGLYGCRIIYPDLPCGGVHLHGNIFYDVDWVCHTNSGRGMQIENNILLIDRGIRFQMWHRLDMFRLGGDWSMVEKLLARHFDRPPYSRRYPELRQLARDFATEDDQLLARRLPKDNILRRNVSWGRSFLQLPSQASLQDVRVQDNVIADGVVLTGSLDESRRSKTYRNGDAAAAKVLGQYGNRIVAGDPGLDDLASQDFHFTPGSPATKIGFQPIPFDRIGLYVDEFRKPVPVRVYAPTLRPYSGTFGRSLAVHILPTPLPHNPKCVIRYTLDGSEPRADSPVYTGPIILRQTSTIKAAAFVNGGRVAKRSESVSGSYRATE